MNKPMQETGNFPERQVKQYAGVTESGLQVIMILALAMERMN